MLGALASRGRIPHMEGETRQGESGGHRAVLWHGPGVAPPVRLTTALAQRGIKVTAVQSPYAALAELCRAGRGSSPAIVILHPETLPDAGALWEAKLRYAPGARCWMYGPAAKPTLRAIVDSDVQSWGAGTREHEPEIVVRPRPAPPPGAKDETYKIGPRREPAPARYKPATPQLKLTEEPLPAPISGPPQGGASEESSRSALLTPEELRMLLGDDEPGTAEKR